MTTLLSTRHLLAQSIEANTGQERAGVPSRGSAQLRSTSFKVTTNHDDHCPDRPPALTGPGDATGTAVVASPVTFRWKRVPDAARYEVIYSVQGGANDVVLGSTVDDKLTANVPAGLITWKVRAFGNQNTCPTQNSAPLKFISGSLPTCTAPSITTQPASQTIRENESATLTVAAAGSGALTYQWMRDTAPVGTNSATLITGPLTRTTTYRVIVTNTCGNATSNNATVTVTPTPEPPPTTPPPNVCNSVSGAPSANAVASISSGTDYYVRWSAAKNAMSYEIEEANDASFAGTSQRRVDGLEARYRLTTTVAVSRFYRVRGVSACDNARGPWSTPVRVAIVPNGSTSKSNDLVAQYGQRDPLTSTVFVDVDPSATSFAATATQSWMRVTPETGSVPSDGRIALNITLDPATLPHGTSMASLRVTTSGNASRYATNGGTTSITVPVSVSLVTPIMPPTDVPSNDIMIIPAVAHADGNNSRWQSDVRIAHTYPTTVRYRLAFTPTGSDASSALTTEISVRAGETVALDDVLGHWFGSGMAASGATGVLELRALDTAKDAGRTLATSRLFNVAAEGSFGQFIAAVPLAKFAAPRLGTMAKQSLVALAQSNAFRTNLGVVEGSGRNASVLLEAFDAMGMKLFEETLALKPGEHRQLASLFAQHGVDSANVRVDVSLASPVGSVFSYASVVDNSTGDPSFVPGVDMTDGNGAHESTIAGVANLATATGKWQSDVRLFNGGLADATATIELFRQGESNVAASREVSVRAGEVLALDDVVQSLFAMPGAGGALRIISDASTPLVAAARTYHARPEGTFGQFIPGSTIDEAAVLGGNALRILQVEDSVRFRTNVGLTEVAGRETSVEVTVDVPGTKAAAVTRVDLKANEFRQLNSVLRSMGLEDAYNASVTVRVVSGEGRVLAYGSVIDNQTQDPTYVIAQ